MKNEKDKLVLFREVKMVRREDVGNSGAVILIIHMYNKKCGVRQSNKLTSEIIDN